MTYNKKKIWAGVDNFKPAKIVQVELSQPLKEISSRDGDAVPNYQRALILVRLHSHPLGILQLDFSANHISTAKLAAQLWINFGEKINRHLQQDKLPAVNSLPYEGLKFDPQPLCQVERRQILKNPPFISIILSTRDRVQSLAKAMKSILALEYPEYEVILVDNAPETSETLDFYNRSLAEFSYKKISVRYVREDIPGLAVAHNRGLEEVKGSIVAFTDDDVVVDRYWLAEIAQGFRADNAVGCVTGLVIPSELKTPTQALFEEFGGFTKGFTQRIYDLKDNFPANPLFPYTAGRFGTGANMAFKTELLQKAGGFDPALGTGTPTLGGDDMAAFFGVIILGHQLVYQPSALVFHQHRHTYEGLRKQMYGYGVGLTAFLTKCVLDNPQLIFDFASKIPAGLKYAFDPASAKNKHKSSAYPRELENIERKGMLYGPMAYLLSRWRYRKVKKIPRMELAPRTLSMAGQPDRRTGER